MKREQLSDYGKQQYDESKKLMESFWEEVYQYPLFMYCRTLEMTEKIQGEITTEGLLIEYTNRAGAKNLIENPKLKIYRDLCAIGIKQATSLGITPKEYKKFAPKKKAGKVFDMCKRPNRFE